MEVLYSNWEYHPIHGQFSRIVYKVVKNDNLVMLGRQYKGWGDV